MKENDIIYEIEESCDQIKITLNNNDGWPAINLSMEELKKIRADASTILLATSDLIAAKLIKGS